MGYALFTNTLSGGTGTNTRVGTAASSFSVPSSSYPVNSVPSFAYINTSTGPTYVGLYNTSGFNVVLNAGSAIFSGCSLKIKAIYQF